MVPGCWHATAALEAIARPAERLGAAVACPPPMLADLTGLASKVMEKVRALDVPSQSEYVADLTMLGSVEAVVLLAAGLFCLFRGWKVFKTIVIVNAAALGVLIGWYLGGLLEGENAPLFCGLAGGAVLGVLAWPAMKYAISVMGGLAGSFLGYVLWIYVARALGRTDVAAYAWVGALLGLITLGLLAFVIFRLVVVIFTSVQGSLMAISGILGILLKSEAVRQNYTSPLSTNMHLLLLLIGTPAVVGFTFQQAALAKKAKKKKKAMEGGD